MTTFISFICAVIIIMFAQTSYLFIKRLDYWDDLTKFLNKRDEEIFKKLKK